MNGKYLNKLSFQDLRSLLSQTNLMCHRQLSLQACSTIEASKGPAVSIWSIGIDRSGISYSARGVQSKNTFQRLTSACGAITRAILEKLSLIVNGHLMVELLIQLINWIISIQKVFHKAYSAA